MNKKELNELLNGVEEDGVIDDILKGTDLYKSSLSLDNFKPLIGTDKDITSFVDSVKDTHLSKGIETWKANNLNKMIDAEVLKRTGKNETPEQKEIRELKERLDKADKNTQKANMIAKYKDTLAEKKLNPKLMDFLINDDEEVLKANIDIIANIISENAKVLRDDALISGNYVPPINKGITGKITWEQVQENPKELYSKWVDQEKQ